MVSAPGSKLKASDFVRATRQLWTIQRRYRGPVPPYLQSTATDLALTQTDLANMVGGTRQTVNRILSDLDQRGVIHLEGKLLIIRRPEVLRRRAGMPVSSQ